MKAYPTPFGCGILYLEGGEKGKGKRGKGKKGKLLLPIPHSPFPIPHSLYVLSLG